MVRSVARNFVHEELMELENAYGKEWLLEIRLEFAEVLRWKFNKLNAVCKKILLSFSEIESIYHEVSTRSRLEFKKRSAKNLNILWDLFRINTMLSFFIITALPIMPICCRLPSTNKRHLRVDHPLTSQYGAIITANRNVLDKWSTPRMIYIRSVHRLQYEVRKLIDKPKNNMDREWGGESWQKDCILKNFRGKFGIPRRHLMGKRQDFSARSVITPDPGIGIDEVGIPVHVAKTLAFPEMVNELNLAKLKQLCVNGPDELEGANFIKRNGEFGEELLDLSSLNIENRRQKADELKVGDVVERHLKDGDYVCLNRQPSLHKTSMMVLRVKIMPGMTIRINLAITIPYGADFDGDEMNIYAMMQYPSLAEGMTLASPFDIKFDPQDGTPIIALVQDEKLALSILSEKGTMFTKDELMNFLVEIPTCQIPQPAIVKPVPLWTGKQVLSILFKLTVPISYRRDLPEQEGIDDLDEILELYGMDEVDERLRRVAEREDAGVLIVNGDFLTGRFSHQDIAPKQTSIGNVFLRADDSRKYHKFLRYVQTIGNKMLVEMGFSVGIRDIMKSDKISDAKREFEVDVLVQAIECAQMAYPTISKLVELVIDVVRVFEKRELDQSVGERIAKMIIDDNAAGLVQLCENLSIFDLTLQRFQRLLPSRTGRMNNAGGEFNQFINSYSMGLANKVMNDEKMKRENSIWKMIHAGSKGSEINLLQINTMVGQIMVNGMRVPRHYRGEQVVVKGSDGEYRSQIGESRTLTTFSSFQRGVELLSRGLCLSSFADGLNPVEFFHHAISGRNGLTDTAIKTAATGYLNRRLIKALEDLRTYYDGTVRSSLGRLYQAGYGSGNFSPAFNVSQRFDKRLFDGTVGVDEMADMCLGGDFHYIDDLMAFQLLQWHLDEVNRVRSLKYLDPVIGLADDFIFPVNFDRLCHDVLNLHCTGELDENFDLISFIDLCLEKLITIFLPQLYGERCWEIMQSSTVSYGTILGMMRVGDAIRDQLPDQIVNRKMTYTEAILRVHLCAESLISRFELDVNSVRVLFDRVKDGLVRARNHPGEAVGILAGQAFGESFTQQTLRSFYFAGVGGLHINTGFDRANEVFTARSRAKTPITVFTFHDWVDDPEYVCERITRKDVLECLRKDDPFQIKIEPDVEPKQCCGMDIIILHGKTVDPVGSLKVAPIINKISLQQLIELARVKYHLFLSSDLNDVRRVCEFVRNLHRNVFKIVKTSENDPEIQTQYHSELGNDEIRILIFNTNLISIKRVGNGWINKSCDGKVLLSYLREHFFRTLLGIILRWMIYKCGVFRDDILWLLHDRKLFPRRSFVRELKEFIKRSRIGPEEVERLLRSLGFDSAYDLKLTGKEFPTKRKSIIQLSIDDTLRLGTKGGINYRYRVNPRNKRYVLNDKNLFQSIDEFYLKYKTFNVEKLKKVHNDRRGNIVFSKEMYKLGFENEIDIAERALFNCFIERHWTVQVDRFFSDVAIRGDFEVGIEEVMNNFFANWMDDESVSKEQEWDAIQIAKPDHFFRICAHDSELRKKLFYLLYNSFRNQMNKMFEKKKICKLTIEIFGDDFIQCEAGKNYKLLYMLRNYYEKHVQFDEDSESDVLELLTLFVDTYRNYYEMNGANRLIQDILSSVVHGSEQLTNPVIREVRHGDMVLKKLIFHGIDMEIGKLFPEIDSSKTVTNDNNEIFRKLGVAAGKESIRNELMTINDTYGCSIQPSHLDIVSDWMSWKGKMRPMNSRGTNVIDDSRFLAQCSNERPRSTFKDHVTWCTEDELLDISSRIMLGIEGDVGTGILETIVDVEKLGNGADQGSFVKGGKMNEVLNEPEFIVTDPTPYEPPDEIVKPEKQVVEPPLVTPTWKEAITGMYNSKRLETGRVTKSKFSWGSSTSVMKSRLFRRQSIF